MIKSFHALNLSSSLRARTLPYYQFIGFIVVCKPFTVINPGFGVFKLFSVKKQKKINFLYAKVHTILRYKHKIFLNGAIFFRRMEGNKIVTKVTKRKVLK